MTDPTITTRKATMKLEKTINPKFATLVNDFIESNQPLDLSVTAKAVDNVLSALMHKVRRPDEWGTNGQRGHFAFAWNGLLDNQGWPLWSVTITVSAGGTLSLDALRGKKGNGYEGCRTQIAGLTEKEICTIALMLIESMDAHAKAEKKGSSK